MKMSEILGIPSGAAPRAGKRLPGPRLMRALAGLLCAAAALGAHAQAAPWPSKPVHLIVSWPPGGGADNVARVLAQQLAVHLDQSVVIENRAGAGGMVGAMAVARADPDGYTLLFASDAELTIAPAVRKSVPYDPLKDLTPISLISSGPFMLAASAGFPPNSLPELVAYAKNNPGKVNYGSFGPGTNGHMLGEQLNATAGIDTVHVAYKGSAPALSDLVGGQIQYAFFSPMAVMDMVREKKIKAIALLAPKRLDNAGDIPTAAEQGLSTLVGGTRFGLLGPAGTPKAVVDKMHAAVVASLRSPEIRKSFDTMYTLPIGSSPDEFRTFIQTETGKWRKLANDIGMQLD